jgi:hypothetical protein
MTDIEANGVHRIHAGGEKGSVARTAVTEIGDYAVVYFLGEFEGIFKKA